MEFENPNVAADMSQILRASTRNMYPAFQDGNNGKVLAAVPLHGDQLLEERARNVQWTLRDGESHYDRLEGLTTERADWHAKVILYRVVGTETILLLILTGFLYAGRSPLKKKIIMPLSQKSHMSKCGSRNLWMKECFLAFLYFRI